MSILDIATASGKDRKDLIGKARRATDMLKALSHEGRLLILCLLSDGERAVSEIETALGLPQAAVSQQLARLRQDGLVKTRRDGRSIYYSLASEEAELLIGVLHDMLAGPSRRAGQRRR